MSDDKKSKGYRDTLNLPNTTFAMKANLVQREPPQRKAWAKEDLYRRILESREGASLYVLHDGPPYANGDIHMGHVINKVLKDIVVKYKTMSGFRCPYVPGWDCHGLPIEVKVMAELGDEAKTMDKPAIRRKCHKYAMKFVKKQTEQFASLGVFWDFENPYLTLDPQYEKGILEIFAELVGNGLVYKQLKPIHWSVGCETALADAELEYKEISSPSIYVNFPLEEASAAKVRELGLASEDSKVCFMIWTTTPWTLAANLAVAVHPRLDYVGLSYEKNGIRLVSIVCSDRLRAVVAAAGLQEDQYTVSAPVKGADLQGLRYQHPFVKTNPTGQDAWFVITAEFVTTEDGTGIVHVAPGHGAEDYMAGQQNGLAVYSPVGDNGCYDDTVPEWLRGKSVLKVDPEVNAHLAQIGLLVRESQILHSYPHCWRSKLPVIFRATEQWFVSVDRVVDTFGKSLRQLALDQTGDVQWIPSWGEKRIRGMLESRPDWCISRQRAWGLPIPSFINGQGKSLLETDKGKASVLAVAAHIGKKGSDSWFTDSPKEILGDDFELPNGFSWDDLHKEENIFDVWFESGCSWHSVAAGHGWPVPVDMYLEGSDQHRGWFQLSMLPALGATGKPPFKTVLTHGFTVDEKGMKQSKSLGNYVSALDEINKYGADILRLWVASVNYQEDMRCSDELIGRLQEAYRKIRNTLRYLLANIDDFEPGMAIAYDQMLPVDRWAMQQLIRLIDEVTGAYDSYMFHRVFGLIYHFCTVEMSSIYMDVLKDRLYCDGRDSPSRRSAQTVMHEILGAVVRLLAPILAHTAEEAWAAMKHKPEDTDSVHVAHMPKPNPAVDYKAERDKWDKLMSLRDEVLRVLEALRKEERINSNQEATVSITLADNALYDLVNDLGTNAFAALCIASEVTIQKGETFAIHADRSSNPKCERCWNYWPSVGQIDGYPDICGRCADVVQTLRG
ncbi:MAG: isoleucine--tRNA ligase [Sedimentisphaerales bacterium]|nr:isoleucine--tRNA ligase [Sedimentisphaerales bacterium]